MNTDTGPATVLLIADDAASRDRYASELKTSGYRVIQAPSFLDTLSSPIPNPDIVVLCHLAVFSYPGQSAPTMRAPHNMAPAALVAEVHRRITLRATLRAMVTQAA
jgi:hypothetical protein